MPRVSRHRGNIAGAKTDRLDTELLKRVVAGRTRREADDKYREYHEHASIEGALAHFSSSTGLDFSHYEPGPQRAS